MSWTNVYGLDCLNPCSQITLWICGRAGGLKGEFFCLIFLITRVLSFKRYIKMFSLCRRLVIFARLPLKHVIYVTEGAPLGKQ